MANIFIVEDNIEHYRFFSKWLTLSHHVCSPPTDAQFKLLRSHLAKMYGTGNEVAIVKSAIDSLTDIICSALPDLYVMDYELLEGQDLCNGVSFSKHFITNSRILFITGVDNKRTINRITAFTQEATTGNIMDYILKEEEFNDEFADIFIKKIDALLKRSSSNDIPLNTENL